MRQFPQKGRFIYTNGTTDITLDTSDNPDPILNSFKLSQNYPNPFNPITRFEISVPEEMLISINVYNILGQKVKTITSEYFKPGVYQQYWDGSNDFGGRVTSGVYIYSASSKTNVISRKMIYLK